MAIPDSLLEKQPLLMTEGIVITPEELTHETYLEISAALTLARREHGEKPLVLRCKGDGGDAWLALALYDQIQADGNIIGALTGKAASAYTVVWLACSKRIASQNAVLGIHQASGWAGGSGEQEAKEGANILKALNLFLVDLYTSNSTNPKYTRAYWRKKVYSVQGEVVQLNAALLLDAGLAHKIGFA